MPLIQNSNNNSLNNQSKAPTKQDLQFDKSDPIYTFTDLILSENTMDELKTVVSAQKNWKKVFVDWGLGTVMKERKNLFVNLYGESGTGKSMSAHVIAAALDKNLSVSIMLISNRNMLVKRTRIFLSYSTILKTKMT